MRTNRARRPTASRRPRPRARAERLPSRRAHFRSRARLAARIQPHHRPSRPRANATLARDRESRDAFSLFSTRAIAPSRPRPETHRSIHRPTTTERAILGAYRETHHRGLSIDRSREDATRAESPRPLSRAETNASRSSLSRGEFAHSAYAPASTTTRARARHRGRPARAHLRARRRRRPTDRPDRPDRPGGWSWMGWIRSWVMIPRSRGSRDIFERAVERAHSCGRSVVIGES